MACTTGNPTPCSASPEPPGSPAGARAMLSDAAFNGVTHSVLDNSPEWTTDRAGRVVVEALTFVAAASLFPTARISPTQEVDEDVVHPPQPE
ncbi:hypothetical protein [Streptomyces sp. NPDC002057]|uniref:hypothetical protein n=1 Tax=Streptomyces sp. NPDC002057 TaxID=3154664 RepID=UPI003324E85E